MNIQLFKVTGKPNGELGSAVVGLSYDQMVELNSTATTLFGAETMKEKLEIVGDVPALQYHFLKDADGHIAVENVYEMSLSASQIESIEPIRVVNESLV